MGVIFFLGGVSFKNKIAENLLLVNGNSYGKFGQDPSMHLDVMRGHTHTHTHTHSV